MIEIWNANGDKLKMVKSKFFELAFLLGGPSHAAMLTNLMNGRFQTASELAYWSVVKHKTTNTHQNPFVSLIP